MRIGELVLRNFKGMKAFRLVANGQDVTAYGDNATGKTTLADSVCYLLFDKDSLWSTDFEIKPIGSISTPSSAVECEVSGTFIMDDGSVVALSKVFAEKYTRKRGNLVAELTGHTTSYKIDGVPTSAREYQQRVTSLAGSEEMFRLLTSPTYFSDQLHWTKRREMLLSLCPEITDNQVIASDPRLAELPGILDGKSCADRKKILTAQRTKIDNDAEVIPARIDEQDRSRVALEETSPEIVTDKLSFLREKLELKNTELATVQVGGGAAELQNKIAVIDGALELIRQRHQETIWAASAELGKKLRAINDRRDVLVKQRDVNTEKLNIRGRDIDILNADTQRLRDEYRAIGQRVFDSENCGCPTCGQSLPEDQRQAAITAFNMAKSADLEANKTAGKANVEAIAKLKESVLALNTDITHWAASILTVDAEIAATTALIVSEPPRCEELPEYVEMLATKQPIQAELDGIGSGSSVTIDRITEEKSAIEQLIQNSESLLAAIEADTKITDRITELKESEKKLGAEYEKVDKALFLIETFIRAKMSLLEQAIDGHFTIAKFKLFDDQINGGTSETCEVMVDGVPYGSLNTGAKIQAGLDIINTMSSAKKFFPPVIIDNRESITKIPEMKCQVINLVVNEDDKILRVVS